MEEWKADLVAEIQRDYDEYARAAMTQERIFWAGSCISAILSALAGLSIAADLTTSSAGKIATAAIAIVPAVWIAIERSLRLRQMGAFNYTVASELNCLSIELRHRNDLAQNEAALRYATIVRRENEQFVAVFSAQDEVRPTQNGGRSKPREDEAPAS